MARAAIGKMAWDKYILRSVPEAPPVHLPLFLYGTAWKKDRTADLVYQALSAGFRAVDTAAQPKHYQEDLVGEGIRRAIQDGLLRREELYIQTKFTSVQGQDPNKMPYNPKTPVTEQFHASVKSSLHNLRPSEGSSSAEDAYIDTFVLHSPLSTMAETMEAWLTLESYVPHRIRNLGISNCTLPILKEIYARATVKPAVVQNRFYPDTRFDVPVRAFCRTHDIIYQSFWTLTANPELIRSDAVQSLATQAEISPAAALYCLVLSLGNTTVLNGTTNRTRMDADLAAVRKVTQFSKDSSDSWQMILEHFKRLIGDDVTL
ncbi:NAD(P)H-dependent D-xylose reductase [Aspergillus udagawae]|nr:NAD(P)H-dependent D-xylose reductase [Aspergillus udagawae]